LHALTGMHARFLAKGFSQWQFLKDTTRGQKMSDLRPGSPDALLRVVPSLIDGMAPGNEEADQVQCLLQLAQIVDSAFGSRSAQLCIIIVEQGGVAHLAELCGHPREWLHQTAMLVLGNLAADSVDVQAAFQTADGFQHLVPHLFSDNPSTIMFALGAIRNTCSDPDCVGIMQKQGAMRRLQVRPRLGYRLGRLACSLPPQRPAECACVPHMCPTVPWAEASNLRAI
jgi:hypothetical protein